MQKNDSDSGEDDKKYDILNSYIFRQKSYEFLNLLEFRIVLLIASYNPCFISQKRMSIECASSVASVKRTLDKLHAKNIIEQIKAPHYINNTKVMTDLYNVNREVIKNLLDSQQLNIAHSELCLDSQLQHVAHSELHVGAMVSSHRARGVAHSELGGSSHRATIVLKESIKDKVLVKALSTTKKRRLGKMQTLDLVTAKTILDFWNNSQLEQCKDSNDNIYLIAKAMDTRKLTLEGLKSAITAYANVLMSKCWYDVKWDLLTFVRSSKSDRFFKENFDAEKYKNRDAKKSSMSNIDPRKIIDFFNCKPEGNSYTNEQLGKFKDEKIKLLSEDEKNFVYKHRDFKNWDHKKIRYELKLPENFNINS
jgi:hypothetical protein